MSMAVPFRSYPRAPITEAVIELQFAPALQADALQKIADRLKIDFPNVTPMVHVDFQFVLPPTGLPVINSRHEDNGFRLASDDQADVLLAGPSNLATARLAPYPGWEVFRSRAFANWRAWSKYQGTRRISRLGVRFINRIDIPLEGRTELTLAEYVNFYPQQPLFSAFPMTHMLMQLTRPTADPLWEATLTSTLMTPAPLLGHLSLLLDIDVFRTREIGQEREQLWAAIEQARAIKNTIFELCVTDQARALFE